MNSKTEETLLQSNTKNVLSLRALEYLSLVALGKKNKEIAEILSVQLSTVKKTLETIYHVLNARDRAHAVAIAFIHCILTPYFINSINTKYNLNQNI